jgi:hypothetical protein
MKKLLLVAVCFSQWACTTTPTRMSFQELSTFKVDCSRREEQYQFLESQKYSAADRLKLAFQLTSVLGIASNVSNGTMQDSSDALDSKHEAMIKHAQREIRQQCPIWDSDQKYLQEQQRRLNLR